MPICLSLIWQCLSLNCQIGLLCRKHSLQGHRGIKYVSASHKLAVDWTFDHTWDPQTSIQMHFIQLPVLPPKCTVTLVILSMSVCIELGSKADLMSITCHPSGPWCCLHYASCQQFCLMCIWGWRSLYFTIFWCDCRACRDMIGIFLIWKSSESEMTSRWSSSSDTSILLCDQSWVLEPP